MGNDSGVYVGVVLECELPMLEKPAIKWACELCGWIASYYNKPAGTHFCYKCGGQVKETAFMKEYQFNLQDLFNDPDDPFNNQEFFSYLPIMPETDAKKVLDYFIPNVKGDYVANNYLAYDLPEITELSPEIVAQSIINFKAQFKAQLQKIVDAGFYPTPVPTSKQFPTYKIADYVGRAIGYTHRPN